LARPGCRRHDLGAAKAAVVGNGVINVEQSSKSSPCPLPGVEDANLVRIRIYADVRAFHLADHKNADWALAVVAVAMSAMLAPRERDDFPFGELLPAGSGPETQASVQHNEELLALDVIVEDHLVTRPQLVEAGTEILGACSLANPGCGNPVRTDGKPIIKITHIGRVRRLGRD
jgi:hypothetical protein